jgi:hypothetical protein
MFERDSIELHSEADTGDRSPLEIDSTKLIPESDAEDVSLLETDLTEMELALETLDRFKLEFADDSP